MPFTIEINQPSMGSGTKISITGLGTLENGKKYNVTDEVAAAFKTMQGVSLDEANFAEGITVTKTDSAEKKESN